jgi:hypothetical protein
MLLNFIAKIETYRMEQQKIREVWDDVLSYALALPVHGKRIIAGSWFKWPENRQHYE